MSRQNASYTILDAKGATGAGNNIFCGDFRHIIFQVATDGNNDANFTLKFQGSIGAGRTPDTIDKSPAFASSQTVTNQWDYIEVIDLEDGSAVDGDTGISKAGGDDYRLFEANINGLDWINARVTARSEGEITVICRLFND